MANSGIEGQSTRGHIRNFKDWYDPLHNLDPDYFIFYVGINDIAIARSETMHPGQVFRKTAGFHSDSLSCETIRCYFRSNSVLYLGLRRLKGVLIAQKHRVNYSGSSPQRWTKERLLPDLTQRLAPSIEEFKRNLETLITLVRSRGGVPLFVTQRVGSYHVIDGNVWGDAASTDCLGLPCNGVDNYYLYQAYAKAACKPKPA